MHMEGLDSYMSIWASLCLVTSPWHPTFVAQHISCLQRGLICFGKISVHSKVGAFCDNANDFAEPTPTPRSAQQQICLMHAHPAHCGRALYTHVVVLTVQIARQLCHVAGKQNQRSKTSKLNTMVWNIFQVEKPVACMIMSCST